MSLAERSEIRDGMQIDWDTPIMMDDGLVLRADVFRPQGAGRHPVILTYGPYAKGLAFQEGYPSAWQRMVAEHPDVAAGSSNRYQSWEVVDPEKWVRDGYACVRVDSRGAGRSQFLRFLDGAVPHREFVTETHQPRRNGRAHPARAGDSDFHACLLFGCRRLTRHLTFSQMRAW